MRAQGSFRCGLTPSTQTSALERCSSCVHRFASLRKWEQLRNINAQIPRKNSYQDGTTGKTSQQDREFRRVCKTSIRGCESHARFPTLVAAQILEGRAPYQEMRCTLKAEPLGSTAPWAASPCIGEGRSSPPAEFGRRCRNARVREGNRDANSIVESNWSPDATGVANGVQVESKSPRSRQPETCAESEGGSAV